MKIPLRLARTRARATPSAAPCFRCNGVGMVWQGGFSAQVAPTWLAARDRSVYDMPVAVHQSGGMIQCSWCQGSGQR